jgi:ribosomal protein L32
VRASQPLPQPSRGFVRRRSVERHQRGGDPRNPDDASAPAIARDGGDLDQVGVPANQFFEAVDGCAHGRGGCACCSEVLRRRELYAGVATDQAKRGTKARAQSRRARNPERRRPKKFLTVAPSTGNARFIHRISTWARSPVRRSQARERGDRRRDHRADGNSVS